MIEVLLRCTMKIYKRCTQFWNSGSLEFLLRRGGALFFVLVFCGEAVRGAEELLPGGDFENEKKVWDPWIPREAYGKGCSAALVATEKQDGTKSMELLSDRRTTFGVESPMVSVQPTQRYQVTAWCKIDVLSTGEVKKGGPVVVIDYLKSRDGKGEGVLHFSTENRGTTKGKVDDILPAEIVPDWKRIAVVFEVPEGVLLMQVRLLRWNLVGLSWWDSARLEKVDETISLTLLDDEVREPLPGEENLPVVQAEVIPKEALSPSHQPEKDIEE